MSRPAKKESTGKAKKPKGKKQFNAALSEQLVLDFNKAATEHGRDALLGDLILRFLEKTRPNSPSVLEFREKRKATVVSEEAGAQLDEEATAELDATIEQRLALLRVRELAVQIVEVSTAALMRRPPKRAATEGHAENSQRNEAAS